MTATDVCRAVEAVPAVQIYTKLVDQLLQKADIIKDTASGVDPPLTEADFGDGFVKGVFASADTELLGLKQQSHRDAVETVFRHFFYQLLATTPIDNPAIVRMWNLLDLTSIFSDDDRCEPALFFWLIEELLDSQTIDGCRHVFDYLESRRERTVTKHFKAKSLTILRSCNELLRRLSRAEDTVFCGRVFIYLFQSFPLGDKSSVNLRGEFHTENVTTYEDIKHPDVMNIDELEQASSTQTQETTEKEEKQETHEEGGATAANKDLTPVSEGAASPSPPLSVDAMYPIFWTLQTIFSAPTKLFDATVFQKFKAGLEQTLSMFQRVETDVEVRNISKPTEEQRRGVKRRRIEEPDKTTSTFNPKYLTSRDLFELEINDVAFRRHILVQALITLDFLLSLTPSAKEKLSQSTNRSVLYTFTLNEEDLKWTTRYKSAISRYLQDGPGGKFYYRMVDTVLTRDKNWVRWKAEGCPSIESPAVTASDYMDTRAKASRTFAPKRLRETPMGSLDLTFLAQESSKSAMDRLKSPVRFTNPNPGTYIGGIADDEFDIDTAASNEGKEQAIKSKHSKIWRILRLASRTHLARFKDIDSGKNIRALFEEPPTPSLVNASHDQKSSTGVAGSTKQANTPESATTTAVKNEEVGMHDRELNLAIQQG
ncbi:hypothetical protein KEM54_004163 [Ascosphaera aggregata]|nr:hypothetical protein KEM54_004163 [Ascosphaera aggregata]